MIREKKKVLMLSKPNEITQEKIFSYFSLIPSKRTVQVWQYENSTCYKIFLPRKYSLDTSV